VIRVVNVEGHPAYPAVITELKQTSELSKICYCRRSPYKNNVIDQDHVLAKRCSYRDWGPDSPIAGTDRSAIASKATWQTRNQTPSDQLHQAPIMPTTH
jgi:transposase-like protein